MLKKRVFDVKIFLTDVFEHLFHPFSEDQPKPLKRGSATMRLADALNVKEEKLKD